MVENKSMTDHKHGDQAFFMIDPSIVEDSRETAVIQDNYKETYGLDELGMYPYKVHRNLSPTVLIEKALRNSEGILTDTGADRKSVV